MPGCPFFLVMGVYEHHIKEYNKKELTLFMIFSAKLQIQRNGLHFVAFSNCWDWTLGEINSECEPVRPCFKCFSFKGEIWFIGSFWGINIYALIFDICKLKFDFLLEDVFIYLIIQGDTCEKKLYIYTFITWRCQPKSRGTYDFRVNIRGSKF